MRRDTVMALVWTAGLGLAVAALLLSLVAYAFIRS